MIVIIYIRLHFHICNRSDFGLRCARTFRNLLFRDLDKFCKMAFLFIRHLLSTLSLVGMRWISRTSKIFTYFPQYPRSPTEPRVSSKNVLTTLTRMFLYYQHLASGRVETYHFQAIGCCFQVTPQSTFLPHIFKSWLPWSLIHSLNYQKILLLISWRCIWSGR